MTQIIRNRAIAVSIIFVLLILLFTNSYWFFIASSFVATFAISFAFAAFSKNRIVGVFKVGLFIIGLLIVSYFGADHCGRVCSTEYGKPYRNCYILDGCRNESFKLNETYINNLISFSIIFVPAFVLGSFFGLRDKK